MEISVLVEEESALSPGEYGALPAMEVLQDATPAEHGYE